MTTTAPQLLPYLERLLDGETVEWKTLGEGCDYEQPTAYLVRSKNYSDQFPIPVLTAGKTFILGYTNETTGVYRASQHPTIIFDDFTTANKWVDFDFKAKSSAMKMLTSKDEKVCLLKYIYYWLNTLPADSVVGDHNRQWISNYAQKLFPLPPLRVQARIVEILDKFTQLEAELEDKLAKELEARNKQYDFYRNRLLDFAHRDDFDGKVEWKTLGEVFNTRNGYTPSKTNDDFWKDGTIPWFRMDDIRANGRILYDSALHITPQAVKRNGLFKANSILLATTATIGEHALLRQNALANQQLTNFEIKEEFRELLIPKFAFYYFFIINEWCKANARQNSLPSVDVQKLRKEPFPLPPLSEQRRIVEILDRFDTLTNSISEGLPREIALRRKQYEYYRDALLRFPHRHPQPKGRSPQLRAKRAQRGESVRVFIARDL